MLKKIVSLIILLILINQMAWGLIKIDAPLPELKLKTINGWNFTLSKLNQKKCYALAFISIWSKTCLHELKYLDKLKKQIGSDKFEVVAVFLDKNNQIIKDTIKTQNLDIIFLADEELISLNKFHILMVPTLYIVNSKGNLCGIYIDWDYFTEKSIYNKINSIVSEECGATHNAAQR